MPSTLTNMAATGAIQADERLRILFLANRVPYPINDGQARRTYHILRGLGERHEVHLLSLFESPDQACAETRRHLSSFCERVELMPAPSKTLSVEMGIRLLRSLASRDPYTIWRHYSTAYAKRVREWVETTPYHVVHCDILPLAYAVRGVRLPFCTLTDHDVSYLKLQRLAAQRRNLAGRLFFSYEALKVKRLERELHKSVDLVITVSDVDRELLERLCPSGRFAVVENGVDVNAFVPNPGAMEPHTLVWVGGFHHQANYDAVQFFLTKVYPAIKCQMPQVRIYIVGGSVPKQLTKLAAADGSIVLTGPVEDPIPYIQRATVFIAPILSGSGTKLKVLEAMAAGKAIVSSTVGVEGIDGRDSEHFLVADGPEAFAQHVIALFNSPVLRERMGANARMLAKEKYDWQLICDKMSSLYQDAKRLNARSDLRDTLESGAGASL